MNRKDRRHAHLMAHLARYEQDEDFLKAINEELAKHPEVDTEISASYLSQLKSKKRNIGDKAVAKLELGLQVEDGAFDFPLPEELQRLMSARGMDAEFEALTAVASIDQRAYAISELAANATPKEAIAYLRIFLARVEAGF